MKKVLWHFAGTAAFFCCSCQSYVIKNTDRAAYRMIQDRQKQALGTTSETDVGADTGARASGDDRYRFVPHPIDSQVPAAFAGAAEPPAAEAVSTDSEKFNTGEPEEETVVASESPSIFEPSEIPVVTELGLKDALAYADRHGRDLQDAKEELYVSALELSLERHLWTPQFAATATADMTRSDPGGFEDERALAAASEVGLTQRLPYGGEITARVVSELIRDLKHHVTTGESGSLILEANLPLLRGAGRVALESRYAAERELIYAVRTFERFRRSYLVEVASSYFDLQQGKARITNAFKSYESRRQDYEKARFMRQVGRSRDVFEEPRALASFRDAQSTLVSAKEQYETALDRFKIFIGIPVDELLDVTSQDEDADSRELDRLFVNFAPAAAIETAFAYRLDLLNALDRIDDAQRAVDVAANRVLPDLNVNAGVSFGSDAEHLNALNFSNERVTYRTGVALQLDDRKAERIAYRTTLVGLRRAQREFDEFRDTVRADVRRALRQIEQQRRLLSIEALNVNENELRAEAARAQVDLGRATNQDVIDAEEILLAARNRLAAAVAGYRSAILAFRLDTGTLRVTEDGVWEDAGVAQATGAP